MAHLTAKDIKDQCELLQGDLDCVLDGVDPKIMVHVCQAVVDRLAILESKLVIEKTKFPEMRRPVYAAGDALQGIGDVGRQMDDTVLDGLISALVGSHASLVDHLNERYLWD